MNCYFTREVTGARDVPSPLVASPERKAFLPALLPVHFMWDSFLSASLVYPWVCGRSSQRNVLPPGLLGLLGTTVDEMIAPSENVAR